ncbi:MAG: hypothetical protein ABIG39_05450 [Candidatus Micrarchaeota archaeon]
MLKRILELINQGFCSENELAVELGMERSALGGALEELCMKGYLKIEGGGCPGEGAMCAACPVMKEDANLGRTYVLTEKGKKLIS